MPGKRHGFLPNFYPLEIILRKFILLSILLLTSSLSNAAWRYDYNGYAISNICRTGFYWQIVPWHYVGSDCYMPLWGLWGQRVTE